MKRASKAAPKLVVLENSDPISAEAQAIQGRIRQRAFELSQARLDDPRELYDWIIAESQIMSVPRVKLVERSGMFEASFAIPGIHAEDLNVMVTSDQIVVKGEHNESRESDEGTVHFSDFTSATVFRSVGLPHSIDTRSVTVDFEHGVLRVSAAIQGAQPAAPARKKRAVPERKIPAKKTSTTPTR
jgi:HSP20 family molecular chaperone IbpA